MFSFSGRIGRLEFWFTSLFVAVVAGIIGFTLSMILPAYVAVLLVVVPAWIAGWSLTVRRLHDRDKGSGWAVVYWLAPIALGWLAGKLDTFILSAPLSLTSFGLSVWAFIELYLLRGTRGSNSYGRDPLR